MLIHKGSTDAELHSPIGIHFILANAAPLMKEIHALFELTQVVCRRIDENEEYTICTLFENIQSISRYDSLYYSELLSDSQNRIKSSPVRDVLYSAAIPFCVEMNVWMRRGELRARNKRTGFFIESLDSSGRFVINDTCVPNSLRTGNLAEKVLNAGKYSWILHFGGLETQKDLQWDHSIDLDRDKTTDEIDAVVLIAESEEMRYELGKKIDRTLCLTGKLLMNQLRKQYSLRQVLRDMIRVFLLVDSDEIRTFLDFNSDELSKQIELINLTRVQNGFQSAFEDSFSTLSPSIHNPSLKLFLSPYSIQEQLLKITKYASINTQDEISSKSREDCGFDRLSLQYSVPFPLDIVIESHTIMKLQLLFRILLEFSRCEKILLELTMNLKHFDRRISLLKRQMLLYVQSLREYMTLNVIIPFWKRTEIKLNSISTVYETSQILNDFADSCIQRCLLSNSRIVQLIFGMNELCIIICGLVSRSSMNADDDDKKLSSFVFKIESNFEQYFVRFLDALDSSSLLNADESLRQLCTKLDFNQYYSSKIQ
eukprot:CAMPEP_0182443620 /NCGR_PEP_ID=MMETSP1172-20130603/2313_1 /TAXON_ID=708627 /ORGANISM="Timspurckia oligopyrenoides, Strain CCMP3278" /LENGTH=540 /DNA_ID=CAMNT_0024638965 /DNA_START=497 /DNA_END=2119 /DNA_ORIENTATION=+